MCGADKLVQNFKIMTNDNKQHKLSDSTDTAIGFIPCYRLPFLSLFYADCMEIMKQYPDKYFDLAIVDPPYGIGMDGGNVGYKGFNNFEKKDWDKETPSNEYFAELFRVSKNQVIFGGNYFGLPPTRCYLVWDKGEGFYNRTYAECELAWTSFDANTCKIKYDPLAKGDYKGKIHPCQKPVPVYDWILKNYATEGMKLLDTHFGSGSIALAVDKANRLDKMNLHLTACEIDKEYIDKAIKRISESIKQGTLSF
jgi:site-specific DNA-methyltransferase (adenine-specific)